MQSSALVLAICRVLQIICAAVVLGTSAHLTKELSRGVEACKFYDQGDCDEASGGFIPALNFGCFVGAIGMIDALVGLVSTFVDIIPYLIQLGLDVLACLSYVAGGGAIAGLIAKYSDKYIVDCPFKGCTELKADDAFQFLGFIITLVIIVLGFVWRGKRSGGSSYV